MSPSQQEISVQVIDRIALVSACQWDACAGQQLPDANPFVSHGFLAALEASGSVSAETGWAPHHLTISGREGQLWACAPLYLKGHSYGEYVFDWAWADAYRRAGQAYYPKLLCGVPFSPVPGPRLLVAPQLPPEAPAADDLRRALLSAMVQLAQQHGLSSLHVNFCQPAESRLAAKLGLLPRRGLQFHWQNQGYGSFDDFLAALSSRKRKAVRKERREASQGPRLRTLQGEQIGERHWAAMYGFYLNTSARKWGEPYLNREFFLSLGETLGKRAVLFVAEDAAQEPVAAALNVLGGDALYGRYWGATEQLRFLHFEACYYRAIDYAIAHQLTRVEAGAQGPHKLARGYLPQSTHSVHWLADPRFGKAVAKFLEAETADIDDEIAILSRESPYRETS